MLSQVHTLSDLFASKMKGETGIDLTMKTKSPDKREKWVKIGDVVYDLKDFKHPGGELAVTCSSLVIEEL